MADANTGNTLTTLQIIVDRGEQARLNADELAILDELIRRGQITFPDDQLEEMDDFQFFERTLGQQLKGTGEMALTILTGALTEPIAGLAGITEGVAALVAGDDDPLLRASERIQQERGRGTFRPRTEAGREALQAVAAPIEALFSGVVQPVAETVGRVTGSPLAATVVQTAAETFPPGMRPRPRRRVGTSRLPQVTGDVVAGITESPGVVRPVRAATRVAQTATGTAARTAAEALTPGFRPRRAAVTRRRAGTERLRRLEGETGVILDRPIEIQTEQMGQRAQQLTQGQASRAQNFDQVQQSLIDTKQIVKDNTNNLFTLARETKAAIPREFVTILNDSINNALTDIDVVDFRGTVMPNRVNLNNRLQELDALVRSEASPDVQLNELSSFRQRLNRNKGVDASERFALGEVKGVLDSFLNDMFDADMVSGDPVAIQRWTDATKAFADYKKTFSDNRVIKRLTEQQTTPEQVKSWILGANAVGAKSQAADVVNSIGDIIGRDSPQFSAIRQEVLFDVLQPLLKDEPNLQAYVNNYDKFVRNNPSLANSVFPDSIDALKDLRDLAKGASGTISSRFQLNLTQTAARAFFGHALSKGQVRINIATQLLGFIASAGTTRGRQISSRVLGYDLRAPVLPISPLVGIGALQTLGEPAEAQQQMLDRQIRAIQ